MYALLFQYDNLNALVELLWSNKKYDKSIWVYKDMLNMLD